MLTKQGAIHISTSTLATLVIVVPTMWLLMKPLIASALADDIKETVQEQLRPLESSFNVLLTRDINALRKEIAGLKFRQRTGDDWTAEDAAYLADLEIELEALRSAKAELEKDGGA